MALNPEWTVFKKEPLANFEKRFQALLDEIRAGEIMHLDLSNLGNIFTSKQVKDLGDALCSQNCMVESLNIRNTNIRPLKNLAVTPEIQALAGAAEINEFSLISALNLEKTRIHNLVWNKERTPVPRIARLDNALDEYLKALQKEKISDRALAVKKVQKAKKIDPETMRLLLLDEFGNEFNRIQNLVESPKLFQNFENALKKDIQQFEKVKSKWKWLKSKDDHKNLEKAKKHIERNQKKLNLIQLIRRSPKEYLAYLKYQINQQGIEYRRNEKIKQLEDTLAANNPAKLMNDWGVQPDQLEIEDARTSRAVEALAARAQKEKQFPKLAADELNVFETSAAAEATDKKATAAKPMEKRDQAAFAERKKIVEASKQHQRRLNKIPDVAPNRARSNAISNGSSTIPPTVPSERKQIKEQKQVAEPKGKPPLHSGPMHRSPLQKPGDKPKARP